MKTLGIGFLVFLGAFVFVVLSELAVVFWLETAPMDITGNIFLTAVGPAHLIVQGLVISIIAPVLRRKAGLFVGLYIAFTLGLYILMLSAFENPLGDILRYEISTIFAASVWLFINRRRIFVHATT